MRTTLERAIGLAALALLATAWGCGDDAEENLTLVTHNYETVSSAATWSGNHLITGSLTVNAALTLNACALVQMDSAASIDVRDGGSLKVLGTEACPVTITSAKASKSKGDWTSINIYDSASADNTFQWAVVQFGGGSYGMLWVGSGAKVRITDSVFSNALESAIVFEENSVINAFSGNSFGNNGAYPLEVYADNVRKLSAITAVNDTKEMVRVHSEPAETAGVWQNIGVPYLCDFFSISAAIEIAAGTTLLMAEYAAIDVRDGGSIKLKGTSGAPVTITSGKSSKGPGDWSSINIYDSASSDNAFEYAVIEYGGNDYGMLWVASGAKVALTNTTFGHAKDAGLYLEENSEIAAFSGNSFISNGTFPLVVYADNVGALNPLTATGNAKQQIKVLPQEVEAAAVWKAIGVPYLIDGGMALAAKVQVEAGVTLLMNPDVSIEVRDGGAIKCEGSPTAPILITSSKSSPAAGDWGSINIHDSSSSDSLLRWTEVRYGGGGGYGQLWIASGAAIEFDNATFADGQDCDVYNDGGVINEADSSYQTCSTK